MTHQILSEMNTLMENWFLKQKQVSTGCAYSIRSEMNTLMENWFLKQKQVSGWLCVLNSLRDEYINGELVS